MGRPAEAAVLLHAGLQPAAIAARLGISLTSVFSVNRIRNKGMHPVKGH